MTNHHNFACCYWWSTTKVMSTWVMQEQKHRIEIVVAFSYIQAISLNIFEMPVVNCEQILS